MTELSQAVDGLDAKKRELLALLAKQKGIDAARAIEAASHPLEAPPLEPLPPERRSSSFPVTLMQDWGWQLQGGPVGARFNLPLVFRIRQDLDLPRLWGSFAEVVRRHESLRLLFHETGGEIFFDVVPFSVPPMPLIDLSALPDAEREAAALRLTHENSSREVDLTLGPLVSAGVLRLGERDHILLFNIHHIVSDGWSLEVFERELLAMYWALSRGVAPALPELPVQFADYAVWQRRALSGAALEARIAYWKQRLAGCPPTFELPTRLPRPVEVGSRSVLSRLRLEGEREQELRAFVRSSGSSMSMVLLAVFCGVLNRYSGREDLVIGSIFSGRSRPELTGLIGLFMNNVPLRVDLSGFPRFRDLLARVREAALGAYSHGDLPFPTILAEVAPERKDDRLALFRILFNMMSFPSAGPKTDVGEEIDLEVLTPGEKPARYDLHLEIRERKGGIACLLIGAADLFSQEDLDEIRADFESLLKQAVADPDVPLDRLLRAPRYHPPPA